jgi:hypothetical protein
MASYTLTGMGTHAVTSGTTRVWLSVSTFADGSTIGAAYPANYYHLGLLRFAEEGGYRPAFPIDAASMVIDVPPNTDAVGYSLAPGTTITITEGGPPVSPGFMLHTTLDGTASVTGDSITVTWSGFGASVNELLQIRLQGSTDGSQIGGSCLLPDSAFYTSSGGGTPGTVPSASGSYSGTVTNLYAPTVYTWAVSICRPDIPSLVYEDPASFTLT